MPTLTFQENDEGMGVRIDGTLNEILALREVVRADLADDLGLALESLFTMQGADDEGRHSHTDE